jgi:hypothetical protein
MINISKYINSQDVLELHINPANIDLLSVTTFITGEIEDNDVKKPLYDDNYRRVKMIVSGTPLDITVPVTELDEFLTNFNLERSK